MTRPLVVILVTLIASCDRGRKEAPQPAPSASVISIMNAFGTCADAPACEASCDAGSADQCRLLAVAYEFGQGVSRDEGRATALFVRACELGDAPACLSSGQMYEYQHGVPKNDARAVGFYERSCNLGYPAGCANWAIMLENGRGVPRDDAHALALYKDACAKGAGLACERARALGGRDAGL